MTYATICPNCGTHVTSLGDVAICPGCGYYFESNTGQPVSAPQAAQQPAEARIIGPCIAVMCPCGCDGALLFASVDAPVTCPMSGAVYRLHIGIERLDDSSAD